MSPVLTIASLLLAIGAGAPTPSQLQQSQCKGAIHGVVIDRYGQPLSGLNVVLWPIGIDFDLVLPHIETNERGEFRFGQICPGRFTALPDDTKAGYPKLSPFWNKFLYGSDAPEIQITDTEQVAELRVNLLPKPGHLQLTVINKQTRTIVAKANLEMKVSRHRVVKIPCDDSFPCGDLDFTVPPDQDFRLRVKSHGFREWNENGGRVRLIHVASGNTLALEVALDPIQN
jgi:protocatechuate 3,4-dioxygenase beta subunit